MLQLLTAAFFFAAAEGAAKMYTFGDSGLFIHCV